MGGNECGKHGCEDEVLVCVHVLRACAGGDRQGVDVRPDDLVRLMVDLFSDGKRLLLHLVCPACARRYRLADEAVMPGELWDTTARFPPVTPVCAACLAEWRGLAQPDLPAGAVSAAGRHPLPTR